MHSYPSAGEINLPYAWQPAIVEISILRAGQLVILAVPGEFTTMAGRRLRQAVHDVVRPKALHPRPCSYFPLTKPSAIC